MRIIGLVVPTLLFNLGVLASDIVRAQDYPKKPIRIVVGAVGDAADVAARLSQQRLVANIGQPIVVENRGEGIPADIVSKSIPDGYTLLLDGGSFWVAPLLEKMPYDPVGDFAAITLVTSQPYIMAVHPTVVTNSVSELIALAKAKPGVLNYGSGSIGSGPQLAAELFKSMAGVNIVRVPYRGGGLAINALVAGEVQVAFGTAVSVAPHVKSGRLKGLAVTSLQPSPLLPGMPTVSGSGVPGYEAVSIQGLFAPVKTPAAIIARLNQEMVRVINTPEVKKAFLDSSFEIVGDTPADAAAKSKANMMKWARLIKELGFKNN